MYKRKITFILFVMLIAAFLSSNSLAATKTFTKMVQTFGDNQSPDDARVAAIAKAKREVLEQAGTYLETLTEVKDSKLPKDEVLALAAGVLKVEVVSSKEYTDGETFWIEIVSKVEVDTTVLDERVKKMLNDRNLLDKYNESQKRETELLAQNKKLEAKNLEIQQKFAALEKEKEELKRAFQDKQTESTAVKELETKTKEVQLKLDETNREKEEIRKSTRTNATDFTAVEWKEKANGLWKDGKYSDPDKAIEYLNKSIEIDPKYAAAYYNRGIVWYGKGDMEKACLDFRKACDLGNCKGMNQCDH
jgi:tetratricopeptide (TPR) repeat protein